MNSSGAHVTRHVCASGRSEQGLGLGNALKLLARAAEMEALPPLSVLGDVVTKWSRIECIKDITEAKFPKLVFIPKS